MILTLKSHSWYLFRYISNMESSNANGWKEKVKQRLSKIWIITQLYSDNSDTRVFNLNFRKSGTTRTRALIVRKKFHKCVYSRESYWALWILSSSMLHEAILSSESVDEIQWCYHPNESQWVVLSCGTVYFAVQGGSNTWGLAKSRRATHSFKSHWSVLSCGTVYCTVQACPDTDELILKCSAIIHMKLIYLPTFSEI